MIKGEVQMLNVTDLDLASSSSPKSPSARMRRSLANSVCLTPNSTNLLADSQPRNLAAECTEWEKKIDAIKLQIDSQMFQLRTQIGRIEELERLVDAASAQLTSARRRRDSDIQSVETQQKQLASAIEKQELDNQRIEAAFTATQSKNAVLDKEIRKQVISLAESFSPHWAARQYDTAIHPVNATQSPPIILQNSFPSAASASSSTIPSPSEKHLSITTSAKVISNSSFSGSTSSPAPEVSAPIMTPFSLADLLDTRLIDERIRDVVKWKQQKDADEREQQAQQAKLRLEEAARRDDDEVYAQLQRKLEQLQSSNVHRSGAVVTDSTSLQESLQGVVPTMLSPAKPPDPMKALKQRYLRSASASVRKNAVESLPQIM